MEHEHRHGIGNERARLRREHPGPHNTGRYLDAFERQRRARKPDDEYQTKAWLRMEDADALLRQRWHDADGGAAAADDPVRLLLTHSTIAPSNDPWLYVLALGEKVAALGGHLEINAVFDTDTIRLIQEPGPEGQPPIIDRAAQFPVEEELEPADDPDFEDPDALITVPLTSDQREFLNNALSGWGGPAKADDKLAHLIGFASKRELHDNTIRLIESIAKASPSPLGTGAAS